LLSSLRKLSLTGFKEKDKGPPYLPSSASAESALAKIPNNNRK